ncbi:transcription-repair coupling factor [Gleimia sp. 6138-11-ORH1]|uniref:transcription-repair coupling factor n=1 Tax=Gleimia sp. 6138-11-ORH1 TaxID=2973937 RepID=UPI0021695B25|nr:transcription-repair coupling factor [Gleimia sp. 6138-11-ORH1]MCS4485209.1 transcription-repair coupling factor [Gleimia sp. 6138-11-ORH1]
MKLEGLLSDLAAETGIRHCADLLNETGQFDQSASPRETDAGATIVVPAGLQPPVLAQARASGELKTLLVVTPTGRHAEQLVKALRCYTGGVELFPAWETLPHERLSPQKDTMARRVAVMRRLKHASAKLSDKDGEIRILVAPLRAFLQPIIGGLAEIEPISLKLGSVVDLPTLAEKLVSYGYSRVEMVTQRGELAVRGGLIDIFPPTEAHPLRVELFGNEVDDIRYFSVADQRTIEVAEGGLWAPPARELLLTEEVKAKARELTNVLPGVREMLELISAGVTVEGMEMLSPALVEKMETIFDLLPAETSVVLVDPERIEARAEDLVATTEEFMAAAWESAAEGGKIPLVAQEASFSTLDEMRELATQKRLAWVRMTQMAPSEIADALDSQQLEQHATVIAAEHLIQVGGRNVKPYRGDLTQAIKDLRKFAKQDWRLVVTTNGPGPAKRFKELFAEADLPARIVGKLAADFQRGVVDILPAESGPGFVQPELKIAVITETDLTGRSGPSTAEMRKVPARSRKRAIDPLSLRPGDFVVHETHGIGKFKEMVTRTIGSGKQAVTRDYLLVEYASSRRGQPADLLYVPIDSLEQVSRYSGSDSPSLSKIGGAEWAKTKANARKAVREIAGELVRLYAARQAAKGFAYSPDTPWQRELEEAFPYVETPDQLVTIEEVKADMEKPTPMDRLLCGDVGYGKTEIAVRAAFKAIQDGKQVAVLVPTTLLVQQHYETFTSRYTGFPVEVASLSRFSSKKEAEEVKEKLLKGSIDLVIGTHSLVSGSVRFKNLGLVIIDEEQRFGVEHKEALKQLRNDVDVLSMSATPIPRTLEMAVTGLREMSVLQTPPEDRHPILTFVGAYTDQQVVAAVKRELLRDGQVFYVHNRVEDIDKVAAHIAELVPEARVRVAHGKLSEHQLERVIVDFWNQDFDVLVCTTIVETGLDISNANTLIVDRADAMGLSQLHQLRGRVGRGRERGYAYFLYPANKTLTETALERLRTIATNTDLGAGIAVAQKDLEIRGAGNLLGGEQSGHIAGVGFDLYIRMVADAVAAFKGEYRGTRADVRVEIPVDGHIPVSYIRGEELRLETYAKIAALESFEDAAEVRAELTDRYGAIPETVLLLFAIAGLKEHARSLGVHEIVTQGKYLRLGPVDLGDVQAARLLRLYPGSIMKPAIRKVLVPLPTTSKLGGEPLVDQDLIDWVDNLLKVVVGYRPGAKA